MLLLTATEVHQEFKKLEVSFGALKPKNTILKISILNYKTQTTFKHRNRYQKPLKNTKSMQINNLHAFSVNQIALFASI